MEENINQNAGNLMEEKAPETELRDEDMDYGNSRIMADEDFPFDTEDAIAGTIIGLAAVGACTVIGKVMDFFKADEEKKGREEK